MDRLEELMMTMVGCNKSDMQPSDDKFSQDELLALIVDAQYQIALMQIGENPDE